MFSHKLGCEIGISSCHKLIYFGPQILKLNRYSPFNLMTLILFLEFVKQCFHGDIWARTY